MFTGIVEGMGTVLDLAQRGGESAAGDMRLTLRLDPGIEPLEAMRPGQSVAVNGACLTVTDVEAGERWVQFDVMPETLTRTMLGGLGPGDRVDVERALRVDGRLDGHIVQGHVDGVARLESRRPGEGWAELRFDLPTPLLCYVAEKGAIAVDGVSLTVTGVDARGFGVALIPTTLTRTVLGELQPGDPANVEVDVLAKYVERLAGRGVPAQPAA